jgi:Bifunctional DNA primase/polymerase, N-terminal
MHHPTYSPSNDGTRQSNLAVAKALALAGIPIFPAIVTWNAKTGKLDKQPAIKGWRTKATSDPAQIERWWAEFPDAVPGFELERAGLVVLDLDKHPGGPDGVRAFKRLRAEQDPIPSTPVTKTATSGFHIVFAQPTGESLGNRRGDLPAGIDVRGVGGWIVAPGAITEWGGWVSAPKAPALTEAFATGTIPMLPTWPITMIKPPILTTATNTTVTMATSTAITGHGSREEAWAAVALEQSVASLADMRPGGRNNAANAVAYRLARMASRGWLNTSDIAQRLFAACVANGLVNDDGGPSVRKTILSGITAGLAKPCSDIRERT